MAIRRELALGHHGPAIVEGVELPTFRFCCCSMPAFDLVSSLKLSTCELGSAFDGRRVSDRTEQFEGDCALTSPVDRKNHRALLDMANTAFTKGNLPLAWNLYNELVNFNLATLNTYMAVGSLAYRAHSFALAKHQFEKALSLSPRDKAAQQSVKNIEGHIANHGFSTVVGEQASIPVLRRHVIRPWGYGFCCELDNVLGHILLADIAGRMPVVWWGMTSIFCDLALEDCWPCFFEPVGDRAKLVQDLTANGLSKGVIYPPKWSKEAQSGAAIATRIGGHHINVGSGEWSRMGSILLANRAEAITVGDYFIAPIEAHTWAYPGHWSFGLNIDSVYHRLFDQWIRPSATIKKEVEALKAKFDIGAPGKPTIAVHVRESDKVLEDRDIVARNTEILAMVKAKCLADTALRVLVISDSEPAITRYREAFGERMCTVDALRTSDSRGVHTIDDPTNAAYSQRGRLGAEVVRDIYLAARCEQFIGIGTSNVSAMVLHLRDWPKGTCTLVGDNMHHQINAFIHIWDELQ